MSALTLQTRALFDEAPYQHCFTARVLAVSEQGVALDQTLFYPTGGGQPGVTAGAINRVEHRVGREAGEGRGGVRCLGGWRRC